ncbi:helix-turn-helix domain-containing protein [Kribbella catacumbae]|uniref:helix-turn-helix domain-containing protein n=1 Tax=Kribbella catacumbae TaxID=460086 RepID=UPI0009FECF74
MTNTVVAPSGGAPSRLIASEIRAELGRQQLSNRRLAMQLGVSFMWVNRRINSGETDLTFEDVQKIAEALNVPVQRLMSSWLPRMDSNHQPAG